MSTHRQFTFERCLGRGGFGEVYLARMQTESGLQRQVAIKTLHANIAADETSIQRLRDEARVLSALHHRSILQIYDLVELEGRLALVTEYLDGCDLSAVLYDDGPIPPRVAVEVIGEVAGALHTAYSAPIPGTQQPMRLIHRDIKPSNIRLSPTGGVKLLDFGIAVSPEVAREAKTVTGLLIGTIDYLAPDRFLDPTVNAPSDVYALGCVLYESLTGEVLYAGVAQADRFRLGLESPTHDRFISQRLREAGAAIPDPVGELLARLLDYDPARRPDAAALEQQCEELLSRLPEPTIRRWARERTWHEPAPIAGTLDGRTLTASAVMTGPTQAVPPRGPNPRNSETVAFSATAETARPAGGVPTGASGTLAFTAAVPATGGFTPPTAGVPTTGAHTVGVPMTGAQTIGVPLGATTDVTPPAATGTVVPPKKGRTGLALAVVGGLGLTGAAAVAVAAVAAAFWFYASGRDAPETSAASVESVETEEAPAEPVPSSSATPASPPAQAPSSPQASSEQVSSTQKSSTRAAPPPEAPPPAPASTPSDEPSHVAVGGEKGVVIGETDSSAGVMIGGSKGVMIGGDDETKGVRFGGSKGVEIGDRGLRIGGKTLLGGKKKDNDEEEAEE